MNSESSPVSNPVPWRITARVAAIWVLGCPLVGVLMAVLSGEHGSVGFVAIGLYLGVVGGIFHALLTRSVWYRRLDYPLQVLTAAACASLPLLALSLAGSPETSAVGFLITFALPICGFAAVAAWVAVEMLNRQSV